MSLLAVTFKAAFKTAFKAAFRPACNGPAARAAPVRDKNFRVPL